MQDKKITLPHRNCTGCSSCQSACDNAAISMCPNMEGFLYPIINEKFCVRCEKCLNICPALHPENTATPLSVFAAKNNVVEERLKSASGGVFPLLAKQIIEAGGVVFGAAFEPNWTVEHVCIQNFENIAELAGSKYTQSRIGDTYRLAKQVLIEGKRVLFTGTPCQIIGLKRFLQKEQKDLFTVDLVCHGVPSPKVWTKYLEETVNRKDIAYINSRDKHDGWHAYHFTILGKNGRELFSERYSVNSFMRGFIQNLYLRPSCHHCPVKPHKSSSDITLGDFWGIENYYPKFDDNKGINLVLLNTQKGAMLFNSLNVSAIETNLEVAIASNHSIVNSAQAHRKRKLFFKLLDQKNIPVNKIIEKLLKKSFLNSVKSLKSSIYRLLIR